MVKDENFKEIMKKHDEDINKVPSEEQLDMIKFVGKGFRLSDGSIVHYIGGVYGLNGDFFLMSPKGEILLILDFTLCQQGRKKSIDLSRFMLVDEGVDKEQWEQLNYNSFKKEDNYYVKL